MSPTHLFALALLFLAGVLALVRGGVWEKGAAIMLVAALIVSTLTPFDFKTPPWPAIAADGCVFLFLLYGTLRSRRLWIPVAAAFQFLIMATHYAFISRPDLDNWAYVSAYYVWNIGIIGTLCAASLLGRRKAKL